MRISDWSSDVCSSDLFGANGKQHIEFRHLLTHSSGLSAWEQPVTIEDVLDWDRSTSMLAAQAPWWETGPATGYHALTHGNLIGERSEESGGGEECVGLFNSRGSPLH